MAEERCCDCGTNSTKNIEEIVKETYGRAWASLKAKEKTAQSLRCDLKAHDALLKELTPRKGMKVLDIGSGSGETVLTIAQKVGPTGKAVGVDFSPEGIALARKRAKERKLEKVAEFHLAHAHELPFPDNSFDAVISECVVCLTQDKQKVLNEKVRVLKPGGRVIMHDVITWAPMPKAVTKDPQLYCSCIGGAVSLNDYVNMMKKAGLTDIKTVDYTEDTRKMASVAILTRAVEEVDDEKNFQEIVNFVRKGGVGYALLVGTKPEHT